MRSFDRTRDVLALLSDEDTIYRIARRRGVSESEVEEWKKLYLDGAKSTSRHGWRVPSIGRLGRLAVGAATVMCTLGLTAGDAYSDPTTALTCARTSFYCFQPGEPAIAAEVNHNIEQLATWMEQKVGAVGSSDLTVNGNVTVAPTRTVSFQSGLRQMLNLWTQEYGFGIQSRTLYARTADGFAWYKGGQHNDAQDSAGGGTTLMTLDDAGATVTGSVSSNTLTATGVKRTVTAQDPAGWTGYGAGYNATWADCGDNPVTGVRPVQSAGSDQMILEVRCAPLPP